MFSEAKLIEFLKRQYPQYIGDDAAIINPSPIKKQVISTDILVQNQHFRCSYFTPQELAHKALHVNMSDIAAMGATPAMVMLGISIPPDLHQYAMSFVEHFIELCNNHNIPLIGGDTTASSQELFISVTIFGSADQSSIKLRSHASDGDLICLAGSCGEAYLGLLALERGLQTQASYIERLKRPQALLREGMWLGQQRDVTGMMDVSDGLLTDLNKLCLSSKCGAELNLDHLSTTQEYTASCEAIGVVPEDAMLCGGEDYSLLFTVKPQAWERLQQSFTNELGYSPMCIGRIKKNYGVEITKAGLPYHTKLQAFTHFGE